MTSSITPDIKDIKIEKLSKVAKVAKAAKKMAKHISSEKSPLTEWSILNPNCSNSGVCGTVTVTLLDIK